MSLILVKQQLHNYEDCSGKNINDDKSCFLVAPNISTSEILRINEIMGYKHKEFPIMYLGCPLYVSRKKISIFNEAVSKIFKRAASWRSKLLSIGGRAILIKHVLQSQSLHLLAAMNPPKTVFKQIARQMARFYWGSTEDMHRYHWSSWLHMCFPVEECATG